MFMRNFLILTLAVGGLMTASAVGKSQARAASGSDRIALANSAQLTLSVRDERAAGKELNSRSELLESNLSSWTETATWSRFNSVLELPWRQRGGDWLDANNLEHGSKPFVSIELYDDNKPGPIEIDVLPIIEKIKQADFLFKRTGGKNFTFHSREAGKLGPVLILNGSVALSPVADTSLNSTTTRSLGHGKRLSTKDAFLIRFELPADLVISEARLRLMSTGAEYGNQRLNVFQADSRLKVRSRPAWLKPDPTVIASFDGTDVSRRASWLGKANPIAVATLKAPALTWINANMPIPGQTSACATVYQKLGADFIPGNGGKLPGFANTGNSMREPDVVNGIKFPDSGWGGRSPDGVHWSARTGFGRWTKSHVASHTYFYAMHPHDAYGWVDPIGHPFPKGQWTAYLQCVQLNTVSGGTGNTDGKLYYEISGVGPIYSREDIRWRDLDVPESMIREFWVNYYCGGTKCGKVKNRGTVMFAKAVITKGLPDMNAVAVEVNRLNRVGR